MNSPIAEADAITVRIDADLEALIPTYLSNRFADIATLRLALENDDFSKAQYLGHSIKGSGGGYGFEFISAIGAELEQAAICKDSQAIARHIEALNDYLLRLHVVYE